MNIFTIFVKSIIKLLKIIKKRGRTKQKALSSSHIFVSCASFGYFFGANLNARQTSNPTSKPPASA